MNNLLLTNMSRSNFKLDSLKTFTDQIHHFNLIIDLNIIFKFVSKLIILNKILYTLNTR